MFRSFNIYHFPAIMIFCFYVPQEIYGLYKFKDIYALLLIAITVVSLGTYYLSLFIIDRKYFNSILDVIINNKFTQFINFNIFTYAILLIYFLVITYTALTAKEIALFSAFKGASIDQIAYARELFLRTRSGWEISLRYLYSIMIAGFIPYLLCSLYYHNKAYRHHVLIFVLFSLMLSLEKSLSIMAIMPIIILNITKRNYFKGVQMFVVLILTIAFTSFLARGGMISLYTAYNTWQSNLYKTAVLDKKAIPPNPNAKTMTVNMRKIPEKYKLFKNDSQLFYLINRITWIPYMTAYDWIRFQTEVLHNEYTLGSSIHVVAWITGRPYYPLEREVYRFQWGQNATGTGSANTVYFIDAFLNFGFLGSIIYSILLALIAIIINKSQNYPAIAASTVPFFYVAFNSLSSILFSGGLIFLLAIIIFSKRNK